MRNQVKSQLRFLSRLERYERQIVAKEISIVGAGQIGSRHLQSLARLEFPCRVSVCDPSRDSLILAQQRFDEVNSEVGSSLVEVRYTQSLEELPKQPNLVIVASSAKERPDIVRKIFSGSKPQAVILEKILFQDPLVYTEMSEIFKSANVPVWVNCNLRATECYQVLKGELNSRSGWEMSLRTFNQVWGLGCNGVHYLDLFCYLTGSSNLQLDSVDLDRAILQAKRPGNLEFSGSYRVRSDNNNFLTISSVALPGDTIEVVISGDKWTYNISQNSDFTMSVEYINTGDNIRSLRKFDNPPQSFVTHKIVTQIFDLGNCKLPTYEEAKDTHLLHLRVLLAHLSKCYDKEILVCPVT